jgi:hypothetical protein
MREAKIAHPQFLNIVGLHRISHRSSGHAALYRAPTIGVVGFVGSSKTATRFVSGEWVFNSSTNFPSAGNSSSWYSPGVGEA